MDTNNQSIVQPFFNGPLDWPVDKILFVTCHFCQFLIGVRATSVPSMVLEGYVMSFARLLATDLQRSVLMDSVDTGRAYTAYGEAAIQGGPMSAFCGEPRDSLTGCYHLGNGHRQFNPGIMRFHGADALSPFGEGGLNAYNYCGADPVNHVDPSGKVPIPLVQRALTTALHVVSPTALMIGPTPKGGLAVNATRLALLGSTTTVVGAGLGFAGVTVAPYVSAAGTTLLLAGGGTRVVKALWDNRSAIWQGVNKNVSSNLRTIFKGRVEKKKDKKTPPNSPEKKPKVSVYSLENEVARKDSTSKGSPNIFSSTDEVVNIRGGM
ncbi:RHS repeat-associated core domain-containing protein [Pseudomonas monteilii]|uniref:RHS repeat-associated core domain-containing protein n=3 Tax=Pseudomonas TaxID=286 RepID=UPI001DB9E92A|nr:RHS repeat-associated core domain-containing protein [Pseudomonas monteilii]MBZ3670314.1 RHS repeat-associated core domain-containing protein [Pseudomonas monteilii]